MYIQRWFVRESADIFSFYYFVLMILGIEFHVEGTSYMKLFSDAVRTRLRQTQRINLDCH